MKKSLLMQFWLLGGRYHQKRHHTLVFFWVTSLKRFGLLHLKDQDKVIETKLRFYTKEKCVKNIKGNPTQISAHARIHGNTSKQLNCCNKGGQETTIIRRFFYRLTHYSV